MFLELKTLVLDLDETLIHAEDYTPEGNYTFTFDLENADVPEKKEVKNPLIKKNR